MYQTTFWNRKDALSSLEVAVSIGQLQIRVLQRAIKQSQNKAQQIAPKVLLMKPKSRGSSSQTY